MITYQLEKVVLEKNLRFSVLVGTAIKSTKTSS